MTEQKDKHPKRQARCMAIQALYSRHHNEVSIDQWLKDSLLDAEGAADTDYLECLMRGVMEKESEIDALIGEFGKRSTAQMNAVELAVLRLGVYELLEQLAVPYRVVVNEAVELCKEFGSPDGYKYINAVLNAMLDRLRKEERA